MASEKGGAGSGSGPKVAVYPYSLGIVDFKMPFSLHVDTSAHTVAAVLSQSTDGDFKRATFRFCQQ